MLPMLVEQARRARRAAGQRRRSARRASSTSSTPYDEPSFPLGLTRHADPVKAYVTIIEGCNDFCAFCVVPYTRGHERMRAKAEILADVRHGGGQRAAGDSAARADRQSLPGARRSGLRLRRRCSKRSTTCPGRAAHPLCQPASAPRVGPADRGGPRSAGGLQAHPPAGAVGVDGGAAAHAPAPHARAVPRSGRRGSARLSRTSSYRPI